MIVLLTLVCVVLGIGLAMLAIGAAEEGDPFSHGLLAGMGAMAVFALLVAAIVSLNRMDRTIRSYEAALTTDTIPAIHSPSRNQETSP